MLWRRLGAGLSGGSAGSARFGRPRRGTSAVATVVSWPMSSTLRGRVEDRDAILQGLAVRQQRVVRGRVGAARRGDDRDLVLGLERLEPGTAALAGDRVLPSGVLTMKQRLPPFWKNPKTAFDRAVLFRVLSLPPA